MEGGTETLHQQTKKINLPHASYNFAAWDTKVYLKIRGKKKKQDSLKGRWEGVCVFSQPKNGFQMGFMHLHISPEVTLPGHTAQKRDLIGQPSNDGDPVEPLASLAENSQRNFMRENF